MKAIFMTGMLLATLAFANNAAAEPMDRFPWDWGTECPFPWEQVDGLYEVRSLYTFKIHSGKRLRLVSGKSGFDSHMLRVFQFDNKGVLEAAGVASASSADRILQVRMQTQSKSRYQYRIMIRAYLEDFQSELKGSSDCQKQRKVMTATFCPQYSLSCAVDENYVLLKVR